MIPIASPLANEKITGKIQKLLKVKRRAGVLKRGASACTKAILGGKSGFMVLGGDVSPLDLISHLPVLCEEKGVPYIFVNSKNDLCDASKRKLPSCCCFFSFDKEEEEDMKNILKYAFVQ
ncbi:ribosomal protein L7A [Hamiltosporidium tvaerminnensis]|uniref:Ribosomal protein L7A n=1 Tax=Hamiltosporidium tvaerminnensis TaxID=1176355 RepID=A0A4Q9LRZ0_9MICR|nr:ribosomal protein L7A [Hamiltosporidium tvaerminnensis]